MSTEQEKVRSALLDGLLTPSEESLWRVGATGAYGMVWQPNVPADWKPGQALDPKTAGPCILARKLVTTEEQEQLPDDAYWIQTSDGYWLLLRVVGDRTLSDLMSLEQEAGVVWFLHRVDPGAGG